MKHFNLFLLASSLLTMSPIENIVYGNSSETIKITMNHTGNVQFRFTYYKDNVIDKFVEDTGKYDVVMGDVIELNIDKTYQKVIVEVCFQDELIGEVVLNINEIKNEDLYEFDVLENNVLNEIIDIKYIYSEGIQPTRVEELKNHYVFKPVNEYMLPKIIELDKLRINLDEYYFSNGYSDCYLLLNHGLKGSDFKKSEEDFYKVPLNCKFEANSLNFSLDKEYYYDFNKNVMTSKKSNNCVKINDLILSKNDELLTECYLIIEKFGYYQKKFQLDLLLEEKPLFGKNGYYSIKKLS